jgi:hypothetical protein
MPPLAGIRPPGRRRSQQTMKLCMPALALRFGQNRNQKRILKGRRYAAFSAET